MRGSRRPVSAPLSCGPVDRSGSHVRIGCAVALAVLISAQALAAQSGRPPLPDLPLGDLPAAAKHDIGRAYANAAGHPADADAVGTLARVLQAWEQWDAAHEAYARAQTLAPRSFDWFYLDAIVLQRLARPGDAAARLTTAVALSPGYLPARTKLAEALFDAGDLEQSRARFTELVRDPAAEPAAELGLGRVAAARGQHAAAVDHLQRAISLFPEFAAAYYALARSYRALGKTDEARAALEHHAAYGSRWPGIDDPVLDRVREIRDDAGALLARGVKLAGAGDAKGAIAAHEAALAREPTLGQAHANLISLYGQAGDYARATEHYRAMVRLGYSLDEAHYNYGVILGMQQQWDAAADAYRQALAINPRHARARNNLGQILERQRNVEAAAAEYQLAVDAQPAFRVARFNLGRMLLALGRTDEAIAALEKIVEPRDAEAPTYLYALATAYVRSGNRLEGIRWATQARDLALTFGQRDLAAAIERDLARNK